jgi:type IX secretion system PorP/SprF family membrane protein
MFKKIGLVLLVIFTICLNREAKAQDPQFTQFYSNPLYLNPAFAGTARCPRFIMNFRDQWPGLSGMFVTYMASYDQHVDVLQGGIGLMVMNDRQGHGTINTTRASGIYSYQMNVNRNFSVKMGLEATFFQKSLDWSKLTFGDMIDSRYGFIYETNEVQPEKTTSSGVDFSAGLVGYSKKYFFGLAGHHLTQPQESLIDNGFSRLPMKITAHGGAMLHFNERKPDDGYISPNILFMYQGPKFSQLNLGMYVSKGPVVGGIWYRNGPDALIVSVGLHSDMVKIGYSYDVTISKLATANSLGSHEISFAVQFDCRPKKRKIRALSCPSF